MYLQEINKDNVLKSEISIPNCEAIFTDEVGLKKKDDF